VGLRRLLWPMCVADARHMRCMQRDMSLAYGGSFALCDSGMAGCVPYGSSCGTLMYQVFFWYRV
jgi:hypothetical protein